jgi:hypothetical protein
MCEGDDVIWIRRISKTHEVIGVSQAFEVAAPLASPISSGTFRSFDCQIFPEMETRRGFFFSGSGA